MQQKTDAKLFTEKKIAINEKCKSFFKEVSKLSVYNEESESCRKAYLFSRKNLTLKNASYLVIIF